MANKIHISIPNPCSENWQEMSTTEKGRFCASCQKNVIDFTFATDREIVNEFNRNKNLCGRFNTAQLERELTIPKDKSSIWMATTSAMISFLGFGTYEAYAQGNVKIEQTEKKTLGFTPKEIIIMGQILDDDQIPLEDVLITVKNKSNISYTDSKGNFSITIHQNDVVIFSKTNFETEEFQFENAKKSFLINLANRNNKMTHTSVTVGMIISKRRTFFGRVFHSIGNWFK